MHVQKTAITGLPLLVAQCGLCGELTTAGLSLGFIAMWLYRDCQCWVGWDSTHAEAVWVPHSSATGALEPLTLLTNVWAQTYVRACGQGLASWHTKLLNLPQHVSSGCESPLGVHGHMHA